MPRSGGTIDLVDVDGPYKGQTRPYPVHVAEMLLATGQAKRPPQVGPGIGAVVETATVTAPEVRAGPAPTPESAPEWTLKTTPEEYLERYGDDGPNSNLAHQVIAAREG